MSLRYLASPYSKYPGGREEAYQEACKMAANLMEKGYNIFCPIAHSHAIETLGMTDVHDGDWWLKQDFAVLENCDELLVYQMPGWDESYGVRQEIDYAEQLGIPIKYLQYKKKNGNVYNPTPKLSKAA